MVNDNEFQNNNKNYENYYDCLIYAYNKTERKKFLIEEEINDLDYEYYIDIDDRKWYILYLSIFKFNYDIANIFLIYNNYSENYKNYKLYQMKIIIYITSLMTSFFFDLIFYSNETMHKIYEENEEFKYNLEYRIPTIFVASVLNKIIILLLDKLINFQDDLIELKNNLNKIEKKKIEIKIKNNKNNNNVSNNTYKKDLSLNFSRKKIDVNNINAGKYSMKNENKNNINIGKDSINKNNDGKIELKDNNEKKRRSGISN